MSGYKNFAIVGAGKTGSFIVRQFLKDKVAGTSERSCCPYSPSKHSKRSFPVDVCALILDHERNPRPLSTQTAAPK